LRTYFVPAIQNGPQFVIFSNGMGNKIMNTPVMQSFWVDFPVNEQQYSKLKLKFRRRRNFYEIQNAPPELRIRTLCTFGGDDNRVISVEARGDIDSYHTTLEVMNDWIVNNLGEY
jgi:hypothetical protein